MAAIEPVLLRASRHGRLFPLLEIKLPMLLATELEVTRTGSGGESCALMRKRGSTPR
jgi:hypothetical protein